MQWGIPRALAQGEEQAWRHQLSGTVSFQSMLQTAHGKTLEPREPVSSRQTLLKKKQMQCLEGMFSTSGWKMGDKGRLLLHVNESCPAHLAMGFFLQLGSGDFNLPLCMEVITPIKGNR